MRSKKLSEDDIVKELEGPDSSPTALYRELGEEGFPVCKKCGAYSADQSFCAKHIEESVQRQRRKARTGGEAIKLPPASGARPLFLGALEALKSTASLRNLQLRAQAIRLEEYADPFEALQAVSGPSDELGELVEYLQGDRFVSGRISREPDELEGVRIYPEDLTPEEWEEACEHFGHPPSAKVLISEEIPYPIGYNRAPAKILVQLIGVYTILGMPLKPLVEKLHPEPSSAELERIERLIHGHKTESGNYIPGMMDKLRLIARAVRGASLRQGPQDELSRRELWFAWVVDKLKGEGLSSPQIYKELEILLTPDEINRLSKLRPKRPGWRPPRKA